jgi:hypothetical protein
MRAWLANVGCVGVAAGALALGLLVGGEAEANHPGSRASIAAPRALTEGTGEVPLGESMELWGQPTRLSTFWTPDPVVEVVRIYVEAWQKSGLDPQVREIDKVTAVHALESETGLMRSVTVIDLGEERLVVPNVSDVRTIPDLGPRHAPVPIPENATAYLGQVADDTTSLTFSANYLVPLEPDRLLAFYKRELEPDGYEVQQGALSRRTREAASAEYGRGKEWISIVATRTSTERDQRPASFVVVTHTRALDFEPEAGR